MALRKLTAADVRRRCDPASLPFESTADVTADDDVLGQPRALRALDFGVSIDAPGYNVFVLGPNGSGRTSSIQRVIYTAAGKQPVAGDWVYVYNFGNPRTPLALRLLPGAASKLRDVMDDLLRQAREKLPAAFETDAYDSARDAVTNEFETVQSRELEAIQTAAGEQQLSLTRTATGLDITPASEAVAMNAERLNARAMLLESLEDALRRVRESEKVTHVNLARLEASVADTVLTPLMRDVLSLEDELVERAHRDALRTYLAAAKQDLIQHISLFRPREQAPDLAQFELFLNRYRINVFVTNAHGQNETNTGAPVITEESPTYYNVLGRIDRTLALSPSPIVVSNTVDHMMLRPGALHRANGGYLILNARDLLNADHAFTALNRALKRGAIRIEEPNEGISIGAPMLEPQPIPLKVKVVIHGSGQAYWEAHAREEAFRDLFKVRAEFVTQMARNDDNVMAYARFLRTRVDAEGLPHFSRDAVAWLIEHGSREADDQNKLSTRFGELADIAREAAYWARSNGHDIVQRSDMRMVLEERRLRLNRYEEDLREYTLRGGYYLKTSGEEVGQINGLSVIDLGEYDFGKPTRITARSYVTRGGINDLDRAVNYTDASHNKGISLIDSYLSGLYSVEQPLSVSANVVFEQSLGQHEGDSASCAILIAMLSAVTSQPLPQTIAITGSLDQSGFVRPIGGASTKIEGFFEICKARGLDGTHGAVLPVANGTDLMLREDVTEAVANGQFHVWTAEHVDDLIELYFGMPAGRRAEDNRFPQGTLHALVETALREINERLDGRRRGQSSPPADAQPDALTLPAFDPMI